MKFNKKILFVPSITLNLSFRFGSSTSICFLVLPGQISSFFLCFQDSILNPNNCFYSRSCFAIEVLISPFYRLLTDTRISSCQFIFFCLLLSLVYWMQVFLSMLLKVTFLDLPLWHRILVLEVLRVTLEVEAYLLFRYYLWSSEYYVRTL